MAVRFKCADCGKDGTMCDCHKNREPTPREYWDADYAREKELRKLKDDYYKLTGQHLRD